MLTTPQTPTSPLTPPQRYRVRRLAVCYVPVSLLIMVAGVQMLLSAGQHLLPPSKGGGFGMFATVDTLKTRLLRVFIIDDAGRSRPIRPNSGQWGRSLRHIRALPTRQQLRHIAQQVAKVYPHVKAVRVSVWTHSFKASSQQVALRAVQEALWEAKHDTRH